VQKWKIGLMFSAKRCPAGERINQEFSKTVISFLDIVRHCACPDSIIFEDPEQKAWTLGYLEKKVYQIGGGFDTDWIETISVQGVFQVRLEYGLDLQPSHFLCRYIIANVEAASALSSEDLKRTLNVLISSGEPYEQ
jgi:hypothetical protein